eukprot:1161151-Pelagomonas_calceolata.AAC.10
MPKVFADVRQEHLAQVGGRRNATSVWHDGSRVQVHMCWTCGGSRKKQHNSVDAGEALMEMSTSKLAGGQQLELPHEVLVLNWAMRMRTAYEDCAQHICDSHTVIQHPLWCLQRQSPHHSKQSMQSWTVLRPDPPPRTTKSRFACNRGRHLNVVSA